MRAAVQVVEGAWWAGIDVVQVGVEPAADGIDDYYEHMVVEVTAAPAEVDDYYLHFEIVHGEVIMEDPAFSELEMDFFRVGDTLVS